MWRNHRTARLLDAVMPRFRRAVYAVALAVLNVMTASPALAQKPDLKAMWRDGKPGRAADTRIATTTKKPPAIVPTAPKKSVQPATDTSARRVRAPERLVTTADSQPAIVEQNARLEALELLVQEQSLMIAELLGRLTPADRPLRSGPMPDSAASVSAAPTLAPLVMAPDELSRRLDSLRSTDSTIQRELAAAQGRISKALSGLGDFRFSADIRARYENFVQSGGFVTRHRERTRARLTLTGNLSSEITGGFAVSTGAIDDPSPNNTSTGFFSRKVVGFDRYYLTYRPAKLNQLSITAGKFATPWYKTTLTFGNDIYPEGVSQTYSHAFARTSPLQNVTLVSFALPFNEVAAGQDSYMLGAQLQTRWRLSPRTTLRLYAMSLAVEHPDAIAVAVAGGTWKPATATNSLRTDAAGKVIGYATGFRYRDLIAAVDFAVAPRLPVSVQLEVLENRRAEDERMAWHFDARAGRLSERNDVQANYTMFHIQRDAVLSAFNETDLRAGTNVVSHRLGLSYQWQPNVTLQSAVWLGSLLRPSLTPGLMPADARASCGIPSSACTDPTLRRLQFDLIYKY